jgi:hypothetical protein
MDGTGGGGATFLGSSATTGGGLVGRGGGTVCFVTSSGLVSGTFVGMAGGGFVGDTDLVSGIVPKGDLDRDGTAGGGEVGAAEAGGQIADALRVPTSGFSVLVELTASGGGGPFF